MGRVSNFFKKIDDKVTDIFLGPLDDLKESRQERDRARSRRRQASLDSPSRRNWSPGRDYDEPKRRTIDDIRHRTSDLHHDSRRSSRRSLYARYHNPNRYTEEQSSSGSEDVTSRNSDCHRQNRKYRKLEDDKNLRPSNPEISRMASIRRAMSMGKRGKRGGNARSEGNLARDVHISPGDYERGRDTSPRKSEPLLPRARSKSRNEATRPRRDNKPPSRSRTQKRQNQAGDAPPVPPIPQKWVEEARNNAQLPSRPNSRPTPARNIQAELYEQIQREAVQKKLQKPAVRSDRCYKEHNEDVRVAAEIDKKCNEEDRRRAAENAALTASNKKQEGIEEEVRRRESEKADKQRIDRLEREVARLSELARQRECAEGDNRIALAREVARQQEAARQREKAEKRKKAEDPERTANSAWIVEAERVRKEEERAVNAARMMQEELARQESVKRDNEAARLRAFSPKGGVGGSQLQRRQILGLQAETGGYAPPDMQLGRQNTRPIPHRQALAPQRAAPLTAENLRAFQDDSMGGRHDPVSELGRLPLGDNTRTFIHGFELATDDQSDEEGNARR